MKKIIPLIILILYGLNLLAQNKCKDAVHPTENRKSILNCCINNIKEGNVIVYTKNGITYEIEAVAINFSGEYIELKNDASSIREKIQKDDPYRLYTYSNYGFYKTKFEEAKRRRNLGLGLSVGGAGLLTYGIIRMATPDMDIGTLLAFNFLFIGTGSFIAGVIIAGRARTDRLYYKNAMEISQKSKNISFGITKNGVGLVLNF